MTSRSKRSRELRLIASAVQRCPDCGRRSTPAPYVDRLDLPRGAHHGGCPVLLDVERVDVEDRAWFAAHPGQFVRRRPAAWGERIDAQIAGLPAPLAGRADVVVTRCDEATTVRSVVVGRTAGAR